MRRLALVIPINRKGQILLQHRTSDAPIKPSHWAFFGGHIEEGETPGEAAMREFKEELQIDVDFLILFSHGIFEGEKWGKAERYFFLTILDKDAEDLRGLQLEGDDLGYFGSDELDGLLISENDRKVMDDILRVGIFRP